MEENSSTVQVEGQPTVVYEGFLTKLVRDVHLPSPYYTFVTNALQSMGCIQQLKRGGGSTPSQWILRYKPTFELFEARATDTYMKQHDKTAILTQHLKDLNNRLLVVEERLGISG
jgi:hypothetical protein